jgi:hypothetical protein
MSPLVCCALVKPTVQNVYSCTTTWQPTVAVSATQTWHQMLALSSGDDDDDYI